MELENPFSPTFGNRPSEIIGRQNSIDRFLAGLAGRPGHPNRATLFIGQRGMGKTALLLELANKAEDLGFIPVRVTANHRMLDNIIEKIQLQGSQHIPKKNKYLKGFSAGALGFSLGLTFSDEIQNNYGFQTKLALLCEELAKHDKGILFLVDEVRSTSDEVRELATGYQELVGDGANVAIALAGLPAAISSVLNDDILTFLNRANKEPLEMLSATEISTYFHQTFAELGIDIEGKQTERAATATKGYPYLLQLIGYYLVELARSTLSVDAETADLAIRNSKSDMIENTFAPILKPLSQEDMNFLQAMSKDTGKSRVSDIIRRTGKTSAHAQTYKTRLIEAEIIASESRGLLEFQVPYLGEFLRKEF